LILALTLAVSTSFAQGTETAVTTNADSVVTELDVHQARVDSAVDYRRFKAAAEAKVSENQQNINLLRQKKSVFTQETKEKYGKTLMMLQEKNDALKNRIGISGQTATAEWTMFKREIDQGLLELSRAIKAVGSRHAL